MEETFKVCFDDYEVSNLGNVRRLLKCSGDYRILKCCILNRGGGYKYFQTVRDKKRINHLIHHLVAKLFIGERPDGLVVDHIDRNSLNNNVSNLRYITQKENTHNTKNFIIEIDEVEDSKKRKSLVQKRYREINKDSIKIKKKEYSDVNKEHKKEYDKKRYQEKRDALIQKTKEWYEKNKEHRKQYMQEYSKKIKDV